MFTNVILIVLDTVKNMNIVVPFFKKSGRKMLFQQKIPPNY